ncbi:MAG: hypothetical protein KDA22_03670 [Phycisphaerales bacterium]|nr:hypothetical protein [Phycisphaerales bacterium]
MSAKSSRWSVAGTLLAALVANTALAAQDGGDTVESQLQRMTERLESLERDNASLREEVTQLRTESGQDWLTEQRAEQIRTLVTDVLADADQRASLQSSAMTAGWSDGFFLASPDGRFKLQISGLLQTRYIYNYADNVPPGSVDGSNLAGFEVARSQITFRGHVFDPALTFMLRGGFSRGGGGVYAQDQLPRDTGEFPGGNFQLYDAWMRYHFNEQISIRAGQFKLPFNREELVYAGNQLAVERSLVNYMTGIGYSQGIEFEYRNDWFAFMGAFSEGGTDFLAGPLGTQGPFLGTIPPNSTWSTREAEGAGTGRVELKLAGSWDQFRQFTSPIGDSFGLLVGTAGTYQRGRVPSFLNNNVHPTFWGVTGDVTALFGGASLFASATYERLDYSPSTFNSWDIFGVVVQGGIYVAPKWEIFGRFEYGTVNGSDNAPNISDLYVGTVGVNWYIDGQDLKFTVDGGFGINNISPSWGADITGWRIPSEGTNQFVLRTQFQLQF